MLYNANIGRKLGFIRFINGLGKLKFILFVRLSLMLASTGL